MIILIVCFVVFVISIIAVQANVNRNLFKSKSTFIYGLFLAISVFIMVNVPFRNDGNDILSKSTYICTRTESLSSVVDDRWRIQIPDEYVAEVKYYKSEGNWYTISRTTKVITAIKRR